MATFEIFAHLDAVARQGWQGDPEERPLTAIGLQAEKIANSFLATGPVHGVFASDNTRCRQSVEVLANKVGLEVKTVLGFRTPSRPAGEAAKALDPVSRLGAPSRTLRESRPTGRMDALLSARTVATSSRH
jgi:broad specificity phosphatase PhoE